MVEPEVPDAPAVEEPFVVVPGAVVDDSEGEVGFVDNVGKDVPEFPEP